MTKTSFLPLLFLTAALCSQQAQAKSVLVPTDDPPSSSTEKLLTTPAPTPSSATINSAEKCDGPDAAVGTSYQTKLKCADEGQNRTITNVQEKVTAGTAVSPQSSKVREEAARLQQAINPAAYNEIAKYNQQKEAAFNAAMKPKIMEDIGYSDDPDLLENNWTNTVLVKLEPEYLWGQQDVSRLKNVFGYTPKEIQDNCQLRLDASAESSSSRGSTANIYAGEEKKLRYSDVLKSVRFQPRAVCRKPKGPLGLTGDILRVSGDNYILLLLSAPVCSPTDMPGAISVTYLGDGKVKCK